MMQPLSQILVVVRDARIASTNHMAVALCFHAACVHAILLVVVRCTGAMAASCSMDAASNVSALCYARSKRGTKLYNTCCVGCERSIALRAMPRDL